MIFRRVNAVKRKDAFLLAWIDDAYGTLQRLAYFCTDLTVHNLL